jgi:hypothetical protein
MFGLHRTNPGYVRHHGRNFAVKPQVFEAIGHRPKISSGNQVFNPLEMRQFGSKIESDQNIFPLQIFIIDKNFLNCRAGT